MKKRLETMIDLEAPVCEVFCSIQGEGFNLGRPSVFVRFGGCNLKCRFKDKACDTPYAMVAKREDFKKVDDVVDLILRYNIQHIVFTGGEPLLYQDFIINLLKQLPNHTFEVETNGTIPPKPFLKKRCVIFNVSPKLKSSNQLNNIYDRKRINHIALKQFPKDNTIFKFVVVSEDDLTEINILQRKYRYIPIYLMPEGITRQDVIKHSPQVVKMCIDYGFNFSPREHIIIWDNKRGV